MSGETRPFQYAIVGAGWRTDFFLRITRALPERFQLTGVVVRDPQKGLAFEERWGVPTFRTPESLLEHARPEFWVGSVSYAANFEVNRKLMETGLPLLTETPPAATLPEMESLWKTARSLGARVQVAEQFHRQPHHAARIAAVRAGKIGPVHQAYVSVSHGYHGTSLIRHYLGVGFEDARISGMVWNDRVLDPGSRAGPPASPGVKEVQQQIALLNFGDGRHAVFDFTPVQYFSPIRTQRICVRGELGEIVDSTLRAYRQDRAVTLTFERKVAGANGNLEGMHLKGITLGEEWIWKNRTAPARLSDEEIAMAEILEGMGEYVRGGPEVYPLAEALQDHYLALTLKEACEKGEPVWTGQQVWALES